MNQFAPNAEVDACCENILRQCGRIVGLVQAIRLGDRKAVLALARMCNNLPYEGSVVQVSCESLFTAIEDCDNEQVR